jgi:hypothetical protein
MPMRPSSPFLHRLFVCLALLCAFGLGWSLVPLPPEAARVAVEPLLPSTATHEIIIQRKVLVGLGVQCREDAVRNLTVCACRD